MQVEPSLKLEGQIRALEKEIEIQQNEAECQKRIRELNGEIDCVQLQIKTLQESIETLGVLKETKEFLLYQFQDLKKEQEYLEENIDFDLVLGILQDKCLSHSIQKNVNKVCKQNTQNQSSSQDYQQKSQSQGQENLSNQCSNIFKEISMLNEQLIQNENKLKEISAQFMQPLCKFCFSQSI